MSVYCEANNCEYCEDGCCEYEGSLALDFNGVCKRFRYKIDLENDQKIVFNRRIKMNSYKIYFELQEANNKTEIINLLKKLCKNSKNKYRDFY